MGCVRFDRYFLYLIIYFLTSSTCWSTIFLRNGVICNNFLSYFYPTHELIYIPFYLQLLKLTLKSSIIIVFLISLPNLFISLINLPFDNVKCYLYNLYVKILPYYYIYFIIVSAYNLDDAVNNII